MGKKRRKGEREGRRVTRLFLCKLRRRVKVCSRSLREHVAGPLSRWIRILRIDRRSPVALVRNLSVDHVGPALSRIASRRSRGKRGIAKTENGRIRSRSNGTVTFPPQDYVRATITSANRSWTSRAIHDAPAFVIFPVGGN